MFRLIGINVLVFCALFALLELGMRTAYFARSCNKSGCNYNAFRIINFLDLRADMGFTEHDPILGYVPKPGSYFFDQQGLDNATVTINEDRSRCNGNGNIIDSRVKVLAVGDSFTFGAQVLDHETWPSALERRSRVEVVNAGMSGYGFGQSTLRAKKFLQKEEFDLVIVSALIPSDLERDQHIIYFSLERPAWILLDSQLKISYPYEHKALLNNEIEKMVHLPDVVGYSYVLKSVNKRIFGYSGMYKIKHPNTGSIREITCDVTRIISEMESPAVILLQYRLSSIKTEKPKESAVVESCAEKYGVKIIDSYNYLKLQENKDELYFAHMTPEGNSVIAEFLKTELGKLHPDMFN